MKKIWLQEVAVKGSESWNGFYASMSHDNALEQVRRDNREERKRGHELRYRIRELTLSEREEVVI